MSQVGHPKVKHLLLGQSVTCGLTAASAQSLTDVSGTLRGSSSLSTLHITELMDEHLKILVSGHLYMKNDTGIIILV